MMERSPKGPSVTGDYLKWRVGRDQGHLTADPTKLKGSSPRQNILLEEDSTCLADSLQKADTENSRLQERIK